MTRRMTKYWMFAGVLAIAVACAMMFTVQFAYADGPDGSIKYAKKMTVSKASYMAAIDMGKRDDGAKKITITSSNKKVIKAVNDLEDIYGNIIPCVKIGKKGTAKVTIKVKNSKGTKTYKGTIKVVAYKNPTAKITLEGTNITSKFKSSHHYDFVPEEYSSKLSIKAKSGWKIKKITHFYFDSVSGWHREKTKKNNSMIEWGGDDMITITMYNKAKNQTEPLTISNATEY